MGCPWDVEIDQRAQQKALELVAPGGEVVMHNFHAADLKRASKGGPEALRTLEAAAGSATDTVDEFEEHGHNMAVFRLP